jgi:hypothetical protein
VVNGETLYFSFCVRCPSNAFKPAGDRLSNLVGTVLLHEVETPDDDAVLIREAARQSPDSARDEYTGLRVDKELRQRRCFQPCGVGVIAEFVLNRTLRAQGTVARLNFAVVQRSALRIRFGGRLGRSIHRISGSLRDGFGVGQVAQ